jgi:adenosylcobinamide-GDP ribazoletransferase
MRSLWAALEFLTRIPPPLHRQTTSADLQRSVGWFPIIGALVGAMLVVADTALQRAFDAPVVNALLIATLVALTGALHLDGVADTVDGLAGGPGPDARLAIMHQSTAGALGAAVVCLLLIADFAALSALPAAIRSYTLFAAPLCGRTVILLAYWLYPYGRKEPGLSQTLKAGATTRRATVGFVAAAAILGLTGGTAGIAALMFSVIGMAVMARYVLSKLPGLTGDTYGALAEVTQLGVLLTSPLLLKL